MRPPTPPLPRPAAAAAAAVCPIMVVSTVEGDQPSMAGGSNNVSTHAEALTAAACVVGEAIIDLGPPQRWPRPTGCATTFRRCRWRHARLPWKSRLRFFFASVTSGRRSPAATGMCLLLKAGWCAGSEPTSSLADFHCYLVFRLCALHAQSWIWRTTVYG